MGEGMAAVEGARARARARLKRRGGDGVAAVVVGITGGGGN